MGFFDAVKEKAVALAADTQRAGKVTAAQARLVVLQNDLKKAERELGHAAFALAERGELDHPDLAPAVEQLRATSAEVRSKEAGIAALRGEAPQRPEETAPLTPADSQAEAVAAGPVTVTAATPAAAPEEPAGEDAAAETPEAQAPAKKPKPVARKTAAKAAVPKPAAKKPATRKAAAKKAPAKKAAAAPKTVPAATPRSQPKAGATPKKSSRPSSSRPRLAGKKRPASS